MSVNKTKQEFLMKFGFKSLLLCKVTVFTGDMKPLLSNQCQNNVLEILCFSSNIMFWDMYLPHYLKLFLQNTQKLLVCFTHFLWRFQIITGPPIYEVFFCTGILTMACFSFKVHNHWKSLSVCIVSEVLVD